MPPKHTLDGFTKESRKSDLEKYHDEISDIRLLIGRSEKKIYLPALAWSTDGTSPPNRVQGTTLGDVPGWTFLSSGIRILHTGLEVDERFDIESNVSFTLRTYYCIQGGITTDVNLTYTIKNTSIGESYTTGIDNSQPKVLNFVPGDNNLKRTVDVDFNKNLFSIDSSIGFRITRTDGNNVDFVFQGADLIYYDIGAIGG